MGNLTKNFSKEEFACKCGCGTDNINTTLVERLQQLRNACGFPLVISSGCRCRSYNISEGGKENSAHLIGMASDIKCSDSRYEILHWAFALRFSRIGIARNFIHLDIDPVKPQKVVWIY